MARFELMVGAREFWMRAAADCAAARRRLLVQAMSFEGDATGLAVAAAIAASPALDRRVLVDDYTRLMINDRWVGGVPGVLLPADLRAEVASTAAMFRSLVADGVPVRVTNPVGLWGRGYPARNHKKLIVADDVAYIGGVNFCDHNFAWHDFMLRLEGAAAARFLAADFDASFCGAPRPGAEDLGELRLYAMDGRTNAESFAGIFTLIEGAARRITVISPYLTFPFTDALARSARRGVEIELITPWTNNKRVVRDALLARAARAGFSTFLLPEMTHLKALLIDETHLVVGSSNFDFVSLAAEEELMAVITNPALIADFRRRIITPALGAALPPGSRRVASLVGAASGLALRVADLVARSARLAPRTAVDWGGKAGPPSASAISPLPRRRRP